MKALGEFVMDDKEKIFDKYRHEIKDALNDLKDAKKRYRQIPNLLTSMRLMAPLLIIPSVFTGNIPLIIGLIAGFSLTDVADGWIARKYGLTSELGKDLDAVCDKVFALTLLTTASLLNPQFIINILLEVAIAGINVGKKFQGQEPKSTMMGRVKTWFLFALVGAGILSPLFDMGKVLSVLMPITAIMQGLTIGSYVRPNEKKKPIVEEKEFPSIGNDIKEDVKDGAEKTRAKDYGASSFPISELKSVDDSEHLVKEKVKVKVKKYIK